MSPAASLVQQKIRLFVKKFGKGFHSKKAYKKLEHASESSKNKHKDGDQVQVPEGYVAVYVGEERRKYEVSLKCLSCPAFQELISESMPDVLDVKIEGPIMLSSCPTERFDVLIRLHAWDIACMEV
ncbi:hypothetical protein L3X38_012928 [Prunus dulcis]|uniref:SAUR-like auxin-responsive protein family n=1 Tax=Prunus dulcis TaxID=3755 RepID=A0AAD4ZGU9_PRUDU|nr:hypothetical protein L3X38_012928 [Prunus dulcis]